MPTENTKKSQSIAQNSGISFSRYFAKDGEDVLKSLKYTKRESSITKPDGSIVFKVSDVEVPENWSQLATDIMASKYLRRAGVPVEGGQETSAQQLVYRIANTIKHEGLKEGYFSDEESAKAFEDDLTFLLINQYGAFNSPVWFNLGLSHQYNIKGSAGNWAWNKSKDTYEQTDDAYERPQCSACFIQSVEDDLNSIFQLVQKESRLFKYGSGTGTNFSKIRSKHESLSSGGTSSGLVSFLEVLDRGAGATKSGGTTRRAAKMVCLDMDHPEILDFVEWKVKEEKKARVLIEGGYSSDFNGEAYHTVSGQNSNNSVRMNDEFMNSVNTDGDWSTTFRTTGEVHKKYKAKDLFRKVAEAAWVCADPGVQFDTIINDWHTCPETAPIYASNPCSEFMFIDDTACNLASLNLMKFWKGEKNFDTDSYLAAIKVFATAQEILIDLSSYPTPEVAQNSHEFRPLGLGYANLGTLLMVQGLPYDSDEGRATAGALTAILTGHAYSTSAEIAKVKGAFKGYQKNKKAMMNVIHKHQAAVNDIQKELISDDLTKVAHQVWEQAVSLGETHGFRNSQMTVLAPTGTIGLLMDCDTTGVEPDFSLVKWKKLAGGGNLRIVNQSLKHALRTLKYSTDDIQDIIQYILGSGNLNNNSVVGLKSLKDLGFSEKEIAAGKEALRASGQLTDFTPEINPRTLRQKGVKENDLQAALTLVNGTGTIEGAPHLKAEHFAIFDCANKCGDGKRFIAPIAHVKMMAAAQPFISGAISKTVNLPHETTVEEIEDIYFQGWKLGLKSLAIYRDGSKGSQPLNTKDDDKSTEEKVAKPVKKLAEPVSDQKQAIPNAWGQRKQLPKKRKGFNLESTVAGHKLFLRTGEYPDGTLGEIFIDMYKEGASYRSMMNCFAMAVSIGISYGVPLEKFVNAFTFTRFEPHGFTDHPNVRNATSLLDFIFRILGMEYLGRTDFVHNPPVAEPKVLDIVDEYLDPSKEDETSQTSKDEQLADMMGDAPPCDSCGHMTVRNGSCYRCLNCGNSMGCS
ncbi:MAG: ribonucleoside-diphosphate reductase alpha chain [bacterium]|jgi:ribonucleoside-diphosphate reductase alpha chain